MGTNLHCHNDLSYRTRYPGLQPVLNPVMRLHRSYGGRT